MSQLNGKQIKDTSTSLHKLSGTGVVTFTTATMSFDADAVLTRLSPITWNDNDVVNKNYVDSVVQGLDIKESVKIKFDSYVDISVSNVVTFAANLQGVTLNEGDRILLNGQGTPTSNPSSENGIWVIENGTDPLTRPADFTGATAVTSGAFTFVEEGTFANSGFVLITDGSIDVDTTAIKFSQFSGAGQITAGDGLDKTGNTLSVNTGTGLTISSDAVAIANTAVTAASYGSSSSVATFTVNAQGQLTGATSVSIEIDSTQINDFSTAVDTLIFDSGKFVDSDTITFDVTPGASFSAEVALGSLTASRFDIVNSASASQGWKLGYNNTGGFEWFDPSLSDISEVVAGAGLTGGGDSGSVELSVNTDNGLSIDGDNVILGGTLSQATTIAADSNDFTITGFSTLELTTTENNATVEISTLDGYIQLTSISGDIQLNTGGDIQLNTGGGDIEFITTGVTVSSGSFTYTDTTSGNEVGIQYATAGYVTTDRSLTDKEYVDGTVSAAIQATTTFAGDGLDKDGLTFSVITGLGLTISTTNAVEIVWGGTQSGLTFSNNNAISVSVDETTITINEDGELQVIAGSAEPFYQEVIYNGVGSGGSNSFYTDIELGYTPNKYSRIEVYVNGLRQTLADNTSKSFYFSGDFGVTAKDFVDLEAGDRLYFNAVIAGYDLEEEDTITIVYEV